MDHYAFMQPFPHHYHAIAFCEPSTNITVESEGKPSLITGPPKEFGGTGDEWSPEDLLVAAVVDCYILSFKAISKASRFEWESIRCNATGTLDKVEGVPQFSGFKISVNLVIGSDADLPKADRLLHKAEQICLITNSLKADSELDIQVTVR